MEVFPLVRWNREVALSGAVERFERFEHAIWVVSFSKSQRKKLLRHSLGDPKRVIYVSTQTDDDFSYVISYAGEENLVIGTDYGHGDTSSDLNAISRFKAMEGLNTQGKRKILSDNPRRVYSI